MSKIIRIILLSIIFLSIPQSVAAAQEEPRGAVYIVQPGDTLGVIAVRLDVGVADLIAANNLENPNAISAGQELKIPGLEGVNGVLTTATVKLGENLESLSYKYNMPVEMIANLNRIVSSEEIYAGTQLVVVMDEENVPLQPRFALKPQQSLLELALLNQTTPWQIMTDNHLTSPWLALPGDVLFASADETESFSFISPWIKDIEISPLPLMQGSTTQIRVITTQAIDLTGQLGEHTLHFTEVGENEYTALQGIHAMAQPGIEPFTLSGRDENNTAFGFSQPVLLISGGYPDATALVVDPITLDPEFTKPEDDLVAQIIAPFTEPQRWSEPFSYLTDEPCINAFFGYRRSYNGSPYDYYHTGVDFGVCAQNLNIYAPAPGRIVYTDNLVTRGNATIIDHGHGVYSGIWHQSEILVNTGDVVETGQQIGVIGSTGRSTGPHLHWELWVNGAQVEPLDWLEKNY